MMQGRSHQIQPDLKPRGKTRDEVAKAYQAEPWWYDLRGFFILTFAYNCTLWRQLRFFGPNFGPRHLEIACGTGTLLQMMLKWRQRHRMPTGQVTGIDYAPSMLVGAQNRFGIHTEIQLIHADAAALPFDSNSFDTANIANAIHCLPDVDSSLRDTHRVLRPGGSLAVNVLLKPAGWWPLRRIAQRINRWGIRKGILYEAYDREDIRTRLTLAGFDIKSETVSGNCYEVMLTKPAL